MAVDRTPVLKRCRQLDIDPIVMGINKKSNRQPKRQRRQESEYGRQLREKQKAKFIYGVLEKQFHMYYEKALKIEGITGDNLLTILESRLDNVVFRLGFARTRKEALISSQHMAVPAWLEVDIEKLQGTVLQLPSRDQIDLDIDAQLIVELYSK